MLTPLVITVGLTGANVVGRTNREIQAAIDRAAAHGDGVVHILAGTYEMEDSLHLRSHVTIKGEEEKTILKKMPSVSSSDRSSPVDWQSPSRKPPARLSRRGCNVVSLFCPLPLTNLVQDTGRLNPSPRRF